jgi:lipopolysaccharide biosynthesis glycosyltransferase
MINIAFGLDDNYAKYCAVTIASVLSSHKVLKEDDKIHFFFIGNLSDDNKKKLVELKNIQHFDSSFIDIDSSEFSKLPTISNITIAMYNRLLIPDILPETAEKIIYLDCDIIVNADIKVLWDIDISNYLIAAVKDSPRRNRPSTYFNSGVIIFNLKKLKDFDFNNKWRGFIKLYGTEKLELPDQDILNSVITKDILFLPIEYNMITEFAENYKSDIANIVVIHFTGWKPWQSICTHSLRDMYWKYVKFIPWEIKKEGYLNGCLKFIRKQPFFFLKIKYWKLIQKIIVSKIKKH